MLALELTPAVELASVLALGIAAQWVAWKLRLPAIVLLLVFGVALGRFLPAEELGASQDLFFAMVSLAVGVILFEGGLSLDFREIHGTKGVVARLVSIGLVITWLSTAAAAYYLGIFSLPMSVLLGALLTVSGPTVVLPLLRHVQPVRRIGSLAKWEGIVNDPIGAVLAALVFEVVLHQAEQGDLATGEVLTNLGLTILCGVALAGLGAWFLWEILRRYLVPDYLQNPFILAFVMLLFAVSNQLMHESGLVTVTLMGVILANQRKVELRHVVEFKENLRVLLISMLFIVLASRLEVNMATLEKLGWGSIGLVLVIIMVIRPVAVFFSTLGSSLSWNERAFLAWIHPRGIVAAAVSSLLALQIKLSLEEHHPESTLLAEAEKFELVTFLVIMASVTIYGLTLAPLARWLGLSGQNPQGVLFAGASRPAREIAIAIQQEGFPVLLVDTNPKNNSSARMKGLPVTHASIGSEFVQEEIDLGGIGRLLAMTPNDEVNTLAVQGFTERFGRAEVYQLASPEARSEKTETVTAYRRGRTLFDIPTTLAELEARFEAGAKIKKTMLSEDFDYDDFLAEHGNSALVLFRVEDGKRLIVATDEQEAVPKAGQKIIALIDEDKSVISREASTTTISDKSGDSSISAGL
ncbi:cation:proton antiporter [Adhaeretor mobilis]|nr:sodium:proton antiporter [Adhaeretor mobilis]